MTQDGTSFILKPNYDNVNEFSIKHQKLIDEFINKFTPEMIVLCKVPPTSNNEEAKSKVALYNHF